MVDSDIFRVLHVTEDELVVNPISEENGRFVDTAADAIPVERTTADPNVAQVLSFVEPGHLLRGPLVESDSSYRFESVEHRGGFSLVEIDPKVIPYLVQSYWDQEPEHDRAHRRDNVRIAPLSALDAFEDDDEFCGELVIKPRSNPETHTWDEFRQGVGSEAVFGGFEATDRKPQEVFIGNPAGEAYWYCLLFPEYRSDPARRVQAQVGFLYDDQYLPTPTWESGALIDPEKLPEDIQHDPKGVFAPGSQVHSSAIPERFGYDTVELLAELVYVGAQFEATLSSGMGDSLDPDEAFSYSPGEVSDATVSVLTAYRFYTTVLINLYECLDDIGDVTVESALEDGVLPDPELLYRAQLKFTSHVYELKAYLEKMRQVPVEEYVVEQFKGAMPDKKKQLREEFGVEGFPLMIRHILYDIERQLGTLTDVLKVSDYVATAEQTDDGFRYEISAEEQAYEFLKRHQDRVSEHLTPAELGGEGSEVFMLVLGRLGRRHDWLDTSSLGPMGMLFTQMDGAMR